MTIRKRPMGLFLPLFALLIGCSESKVPDAPSVAEHVAKKTASLPADYDEHVARATAVATGVASKIIHLCELPSKAGRPERPPYQLPSADDFEAGQVFDNLYYVGTKSLSSWAVKTSEGLILLDALNNSDEAEKIIVANLVKLGLDPSEIKYIVLGHGHGDHYGGAQYLKENYGARVLASSADWDLMENPRFQVTHWSPPPARDLIIEDGQQLTLGDTSITLYITPGHTPGTVSSLVPVTNNGESHVALLWGGTGFNFAQIPQNFQMYADSADRMKVITKEAGADVFISNHATIDGTNEKLPALLARSDGDAHPFIDGEKSVQDFLTVAGECAKARKLAL